MLAPKRVKFRKRFKGRTSGMATRGNTVAFGHYGLMSLEPGWISNRQIEAARVALTREMKRGGKVWIRLFPDKPITKKPAERRRRQGNGRQHARRAAEQAEPMLAAKRGKVRTRAKGRTAGVATSGKAVAFGQYGVVWHEPGWFSNRRARAARADA